MPSKLCHWHHMQLCLLLCRTAEVVGEGKTGGTRDERLGDVGLVVLDEVHYLGDPWRGSVWEEAIINCPKHIQVRRRMWWCVFGVGGWGGAVCERGHRQLP